MRARWRATASAALRKAAARAHHHGRRRPLGLLRGRARRPGAGQGLAARALPRERICRTTRSRLSRKQRRAARAVARGARCCDGAAHELRGPATSRQHRESRIKHAQACTMSKTGERGDDARRAHRGRAAVGGGASGAGGQVLLARRYGALHQPAEDLRQLRGLVPVRRGGARTILDLQMWYSAVNFGYRNPRLDAAVRRQLDRLPQVASQYLHREKIELATIIAQDAERKFGTKGRVHFNVGGSQAVEDSLKLVRNFKKGKSLMFAFEGGYHGRTLGASAITSSYRYRRRYGHFGDRAQFVPFPYHFRGPKGMSKEEYGHYCVQQFARLFESEYNGVWDPEGRRGRVRRLLRGADPGHRRLRDPAEELLRRAEEGARPARHPAGRRRDPDGLLSHRQAVVDRALRREARRHRVRQGHHQRPQSAGRRVGARGADQSDDLPAGLDALDVQRQSDGHRALRSRP